jgi:hypothetical protein
MARKRELREVDAIAHEFDLDVHDFSDYLHELKSSGDGGSKDNGDFTKTELRERAMWYREERLGERD